MILVMFKLIDFIDIDWEGTEFVNSCYETLDI